MAIPIRELDLTTEVTPTATIVHGSGDIWCSTAPLLRTTVEPLLVKNQIVVLDLADVSYFDGTGLGTLRQLYDLATTANCQFKLVNLNQRLKTLLSITTLDTVMAPALSQDQPETP